MRRCCEMAGREMGKARARSPTEGGPLRRRVRICLRVGSPSASRGASRFISVSIYLPIDWSSVELTWRDLSRASICSDLSGVEQVHLDVALARREHPPIGRACLA